MPLKVCTFGCGAIMGRAIALGTIVAVLSGCSAGRARSFSGRFVKPGEPTVKLDAPTSLAPAPATLSEYARKLRELQTQATTKQSLLPTIETANPALASALLRLRMAETADHHRGVAAEYRRAGVTDYAYRHLQRALKLQPCDGEAFEELAKLWRDWGRPELALGDAHRAIHCRPSSVSAYNTLGTVLQALNQPANARRAFELALAFDSSAAYALNNLCYVALAEGKAEEAQRWCERALSVEPEFTVARNNLALARAIQGDVSQAEELLLEAPDPGVGQYNVGILRMSLGRYEEAAAAFQRADSVKPSLGLAAQRAVQARRMATVQKGAE